MGRGYPASSHHRSSGVPLGMGVRTSCSESSLYHPKAASSSGPHSRLGRQGRGCSGLLSTMLSVASFRGSSPRQPSATSYYRPVPTQRVRGCSPFQSRHSRYTRSPSHASCFPRLARHSRGVHAHTDASQSAPVPRLFLQQPTLFFSRPAFRPQCCPIHIHAGPRVAATVSPGPRHLHTCVPRRHRGVAPGSRHPPCTNATGDVFSAGDGLPAQSSEVPPLPVFVGGVARCSLASAVRSLASPGRAPGQCSGHGPYPASGPHSLPPQTRAVGGAHKFRLSGTLVSPPVPTTSYTQLHLCQGRREGPSVGAHPFYAGRSAVLDVAHTLGPHPSVPCRSPSSFSVDRCVLSRVGGPPRAVLSRVRPVELCRTSSPRQCPRVAGRSPCGVLPPARPLAPRLHRQWDGPLHFGILPHSVSDSASGTRGPVGGVPIAEPVIPGSLDTHVPQRPGDALSRQTPLNTEWTLPRPVFEVVHRWAGPQRVDLMASPVNHHLPRWVSAFPHPAAEVVDCRSVDWDAFGSSYLFPPSAMIPQLLQKILSCRTLLVVIVPWSPHEPWFPPLFQRAEFHLHLLTTPFQMTGAGRVCHSSGPSARWTALRFCAMSSVPVTPTA